MDPEFNKYLRNGYKIDTNGSLIKTYSIIIEKGMKISVRDNERDIRSLELVKDIVSAALKGEAPPIEGKINFVVSIYPS